MSRAYDVFLAALEAAERRMKRSPLKRRPRVRSRRPDRPGTTPPMPKDWLVLCLRTRVRDRHTCRRCGASAVGPKGAVDHVVPRRIAGADAHDLSNLALLCATNGMTSCHAQTTATVEPKLYAGDVLTFKTWVKRLATTGPVPSTEMLAAAYQRLRELQA